MPKSSSSTSLLEKQAPAKKRQVASKNLSKRKNTAAALPQSVRSSSSKNKAKILTKKAASKTHQKTGQAQTQNHLGRSSVASTKKTKTRQARKTPKPEQPSVQPQSSESSTQKDSSHYFFSTQAPMAFWNEMLGIIQRSLQDEEQQKRFQKNLAQKIQEIPQQGLPIPDGRLKEGAWLNDPFYIQLAQLYAYNAATIEKTLESLPLSDETSRHKMNFMGRQLIDSLSPANFAWSNPDFLNRALQTKGESVVAGLMSFLADMHQGRIAHVDETQFKVGENVATTPGKVIFRTPLFELIAYLPQAPIVGKRPMLFVPPCINKYYIMDLSPNNSLVKYTLEQGHRVYLISWRSIDEKTCTAQWDDYVTAVMQAILIVQETSKGVSINTLGFCIGGTILATTLAVMCAKKMPLPASMTLLTSLLDFSMPGDLGVFITPALIEELDAKKEYQGIVPGNMLSQIFNMLRPRDLVWNYVTKKYLRGEKPRDFDILYWNGDAAHLSAHMLSWYLRYCYLDNALVQKQAQVCDETVDLSTIDIPTYVYASREDHIVPWQGAYATCQILSGPIRFVLGASGHIAGVINPAKADRRNYWIDSSHGNTTINDDPEAWFNHSVETPGSWWKDWAVWLENLKGGEMEANTIKLPLALDDAPGQYVQVRHDPPPFYSMWKKLMGN